MEDPEASGGLLRRALGRHRPRHPDNGRPIAWDRGHAVVHEYHGARLTSGTRGVSALTPRR
jgi:hypothetical protein